MSRLAQEKSSTGQLFLGLFKGYDLIKSVVSQENRVAIERDFLLEQYLDVKAISWGVDNKTGPGATARAAVGVFYEDEKELKEGLDYFHRVIESQFYPDGSPKEAPIYAAKPVYENLWELPEIVRNTVDLNRDSAYAEGLRMFASIATPMGTQPTLDDSGVTCLNPTVVDVARVRTGVKMSYGPRDFEAFGLVESKRRAGSSVYAASLDPLPKRQDSGFYPVGFLNLPPGARSVFSMFNEALPTPRKDSGKAALSRYYHDRGLACLGFGRDRKATQLYLIGEDGGRGHRHAGPLSVMLFAGGREVFPDLGYIADHPANQWIRSTPAHNTVTVDEVSRYTEGSGKVNAFFSEGPVRFVDITTPVEGLKHFRRAIALIRKPDGLPVLVDVFDVAGGHVHDYQMRVNDPDVRFRVPGVRLKARDEGLYAGVSQFPLQGFRTGGLGKAPFAAVWGRAQKVRATVLTPCDEMITYHTPAWRDFKEVFHAPRKVFETLVLRNKRQESRFVVVYELYRERPSLRKIELEEVDPGVSVRLLGLKRGERFRVRIGEESTPCVS